MQHIESSKRQGAYVATGSRDKLIKLWDSQSGQLLRTLVRFLYLSVLVYALSIAADADHHPIHSILSHPSIANHNFKHN